MERLTVVQDIITPEDMLESVLIWEPDKPYDPTKENDFLAFEKTVRDKLTELIPFLSRPVPDGDPVEKSRIGRDLVQATWWVIGMLTAAEHYLTAAKRRASYIQTPTTETKPNADQLKYRMAEMYTREQQLVIYLQRILNLVEVEIVFIESNLKIIGKEMGLTGAQDRL